jgi:hypothetical protein
MRREAIASAFVVGLLTAGVGWTFPLAAAADARQDNEKQEAQLQREASQLDADAARASNTPDGQRRVTERIANQFKVQPSVVSDLRSRKLGFGGATIALALSQELMKRDSTLSQQAALDRIVAQRQAGKGWGVIAHDLGLKLGHVVSEVKKADKAAEHIAGKPEKLAKADKSDKTEKLEKPEHPAKPEKLEKIEKPARPDKR